MKKKSSFDKKTIFRLKNPTKSLHETIKKDLIFHTPMAQEDKFIALKVESIVQTSLKPKFNLNNVRSLIREK